MSVASSLRAWQRSNVSRTRPSTPPASLTSTPRVRSSARDLWRTSVTAVAYGSTWEQAGNSWRALLLSTKSAREEALPLLAQSDTADVHHGGRHEADAPVRILAPPPPHSYRSLCVGRMARAGSRPRRARGRRWRLWPGLRQRPPPRTPPQTKLHRTTGA